VKELALPGGARLIPIAQRAASTSDQSRWRQLSACIADYELDEAVKQGAMSALRAPGLVYRFLQRCDCRRNFLAEEFAPALDVLLS
jgi:hypothetical protein